MSGRIGRLTLMSVFFAAAPLGLAEADGISDNEIRIGVLNDISGLYSDLSGEGSAVAAQMAIDEFEAQFNPDFSIALYRADHQNKPEIASTHARTWFDVDNVDMITDIPTSSAALTVLRIAEEKNKLVIISGAAAPLITTTLALEPELMLLDEPTQGMGHEDVDRVMELIKRVAEDRTVLMVEHNMRVVSTIADRITVLSRGAVIAEGDYGTVSNDPQVIEAYIGTSNPEEEMW